jgi:lysophospholipase L1-like esterase
MDPATGLRLYETGWNSKKVWINSRIFRSPELTMPKPAGTIRVAFVGSSTTFCAEVSGNDATWPHLVWNKLRETWPGIRFDYVNAGVIGFTTETSWKNVRLRVKPLQPDVIVIYEGINDLSKDARQMAVEQGLPTGHVGQPEGLAAYSQAWIVISRTIEMRRRVQAAVHQKRLVFDESTLAGRGFRQRLTKLVEEARSAAPVVAMATLSAKVRRNQSPEEQKKAVEWNLYYMPFMTPEGILRGYELYNQEIRSVARQTGVVLIEGEHSIPADAEHFFDGVHFTDAGSRRMATRVFEGLTASKEFRSLLELRLGTN